MPESALIPFRIVHGDTTLEARVAAPGGDGPHPAVLMIPGATGPGPSFDAAMREVAGRGFLTFGLDMYGIDADIGTAEAAGVHFMALLQDPTTLRARVVAWFEAIRDREDVIPDRIAAIGYCFGGRCVLELARSGAAVRSVTSFHGLLGTHAPAAPGAVQARVAVWTGGRDPYVPAQDVETFRQEFDAAGVDYQLTVFARAEHSFSDPDHDGLAPGIAYDPVAHNIAWVGTLATLDFVRD